ncbi:transaldolase family protein [Thermosediminibacter litoriperuensis]|uniref:Transaldolase n=1 Tax=Thermosediminibacter litoriperuensis TaxID=291989 RepID=A0A5S5AY13_9FIRM|nr:transaldolase family protein [Thermosediminibacter litoriperuensis]TYP57862.1 transaldolase [Thermosediminibacter litoriperuensis]
MTRDTYKKSAMERLNSLSQDMELWWDSNPLIYEKWCSDFISSVDEDLKELISLQLKKLWDEKLEPGKWVFQGVTTNPPLTKAVFDNLKAEWEKIIRDIIKANPGMDYKQVTWEAYKEACKRGAERYLPLFEKSGYKYGYVSAQVDPRLFTDEKEMVRQALELKALQPNIMVKIPTTRSGVLAIFILTSLGVPTNATLCFTLPQIMAVAEAVKQGKAVGEKYGVDYSRWRSVITIMIGRFEDAKIFEQQAKERGIDLTEEMKRWAGIAITKKACRILSERNYPSKMLVASSRVSPKVNGIQCIWHIEKLAGCNLVYTMNPELIKSFMLLYLDRPIEDKSKESVPDEVMEKLLKIPYFAEAYGEDTISPEEFENLEPTVTTYNQFSKAMVGLEEYVKSLF